MEKQNVRDLLDVMVRKDGLSYNVNEAHLAALLVKESLTLHVDDNKQAYPLSMLRTKVGGMQRFLERALEEHKALSKAFDDHMGIPTTESGTKDPPPGGPRP